MKKLIYLLVLALILGLVLTGCLLSNVGQVPTTEQSGITYLTKNGMLTGLVGLWSFDEGEGETAYDSSENNNHGTIYGATYIPDQWGGYALSFDGNDYVEVLDSISICITGELTIEAWANETTRGTYSKIVSRRKGNYFYFLGVANGKPYGGIGNGLTYTVTTKTVPMPLNEWHHLAFVYNDTEDKMYLYYDGELKETVTVTLSLPFQTGVKLDIGADFEGTANFFKGLIDEVRIYDYALSPGTIEDHAAGILYGFNGLLAPYVAPPKAFKAGRSIPLKWQYTDYSGDEVDSSAAEPSVKVLFKGTIGAPVEEPIEVDDPGASGYRYDIDTKTWQFNWQTKGLEAGNYEIRITSDQTGQVNGPFLIDLR